MRALPVKKYNQASSTDEVRLQQVLNIEIIQSALQSVQKEVVRQSGRVRKRPIESYNRKTNVKAVNFQVGDFALVRCTKNKGFKMELNWTGPRIITAIRSSPVVRLRI